MKTVGVFAAFLTVAGGVPGAIWSRIGAFEAPEPIWLAVWGVALITLSNRLRVRLVEHREV